MNRRTFALIGLLLCSTAYAAGTSIWNATSRGTVAATDRLPVATSSSSGPLYVTPLTLQSYLLGGSATTEVLANNAGAVDGDAGFTYNATTDIATLSGGLGLGGSADVFIVRAAAGAASFRNGTTAQVVRVTDTYTDDSNGAYLELNAGAAGDWVQVRAVTNGTGADNYGIALTPSGTGAISAQVPDSTAAGGNARGVHATDFVRHRTTSAQVASGSYSGVLSGYAGTASGLGAVVAGGYLGVASGSRSVVAGGDGNTASSSYAAVLGGTSNTASGAWSWIPGGSGAITRGLVGSYAYSAGTRAAQGDAQVIGQPVRRTTTDGTPVSLATDGTPAATTVMVLPSDSTATCRAMVTANSTAAGVVSMAGFDAVAIVKNDSSTMTISGGTCTAIGTADAALTTATCALVANGTLDSIELQVTGVAATTIQWMGELKCVQVL